jgi:ribonuclease HI
MPREVDPDQVALFAATKHPVIDSSTTVSSGARESAIVVATDGSCLTNPGPGGWCWYADDTTWAAGGETHTTNNRMELLAVLEALSAMPRERPLVIHADSSYTIDACTKWIHGWKRRGWKTAQGAAVKNREVIEAIDGALTGRAVTFEWVKGHAGHVMNEAADGRCRAAAEAVKLGHAVEIGPGWRSTSG